MAGSPAAWALWARWLFATQMLPHFLVTRCSYALISGIQTDMRRVRQVIWSKIEWLVEAIDLQPWYLSVLGPAAPAAARAIHRVHPGHLAAHPGGPDAPRRAAAALDGACQRLAGAPGHHPGASKHLAAACDHLSRPPRKLAGASQRLAACHSGASRCAPDT